MTIGPCKCPLHGLKHCLGWLLPLRLRFSEDVCQRMHHWPLCPQAVVAQCADLDEAKVTSTTFSIMWQQNQPPVVHRVKAEFEKCCPKASRGWNHTSRSF